MLRSLQTTHFRNLTDATWDLAPGSHLLLGGTGAGKTSLLEALYVASTSRSFRVPQLGECLRRNVADEASGFRLAVEAEHTARVRLEVGWEREGGAWRLLNGSRSTLSEHLEQVPIVAWTLADNDVLLGVAERRRRYLDRSILALEPRSVEVFGRYRRILEHKRKLLQQRRSGGEGLEEWNEMLATAAAEVIARRRALVEDLHRQLGRMLERSGLPFPLLALRYAPSPAGGEEGPGALREALERVAGAERRERRPLVGPHRDRLAILWDGREVRSVASAGERKSLGLLLVASLAALLTAADRPPVLILDDADAELDRPTLEALWSVLGEGVQLFASSNRPEVWEGLAIDHLWGVSEGLVEHFGEAPG